MKHLGYSAEIPSLCNTICRYILAVCLGVLNMTLATKRKTSLTLDAEVLDGAKALQINVSAVAEAALKSAVEQARHTQWLQENSETFDEQAAWHERNGHPLADIMSGPGGATWNA